MKITPELQAKIDKEIEEAIKRVGVNFMAPVDKNTPPDQLLKMLLGAQRDKLNSFEKNSIWDEEKALLRDENTLLKNKLFGKSSEKKVSQLTSKVFDEAKANLEDLLNDDAQDVTSKLEEAVSNIDVKVPLKKPKPKGRKPIPGIYQRVDITHDLTDDQKVCDCGCLMTKFGEDVTEQLDVIPARIYVLRHHRLKYACKGCQEGVKIAPVQSAAIAKCLAAPGLLAHVATLKFDDHLPLYRQSEIWERMGVDISRSTLSSWILKIGEALNPLVKHMQNHIIQSGYVKADESTLQVLKTPGKKNESQSYMWLYMTGNSLNPAVVYDYQQSRKGDHAKDFLKGFKGTLQTDGYSGYHCVVTQENVISQGCFAHARRKFYDVWNVAKKEGVASKALEIIGKLYDIESDIKEMRVLDKLKIRQEKAKPILDVFYAWLNEIKPHVQQKGLLDKAVQYTLNQWNALTHYVETGDISIDNNAAERQIRPFAIGRKNWLFMGSPTGAKAASNIYSLIETAKLNGLNPEGYLKFILEHKIDENDKALLSKLMPWNAEIKLKIKDEYPMKIPKNIDDDTIS